MITETLVRDVRFGLRSLRRDVGATILIIAIAGLGIGAGTTVFSICRALLLRPLPVQAAERLVWIANGSSENLSAQSVQVNNLLNLREASRSYVDVAGYYQFYAPGDVRMTGLGEPERLTGVPVTQSFFPLLGVRPAAGRFFNTEESRWGAARTAVLGYEFWQRRFNRDFGIVGRSIILDDTPVTVIGILPESFDFESTFTPGRRADVFFPFPLSPETNGQGNTLGLVARLRDGVTLTAAQSEATQIASRMPRVGADGRRLNGFAPQLETLRERVSGRVEPALVALSGAVGFLLLLVCATLSNLLLVRASARRREMAVRAALGAPRYRLVRQMLVESVVLAGGGAMFGIALAVGGTFVVSRIQGTTVPLLNDVSVDASVLAFSVLVAAATALGFGLLPALHASSFNLPTALAEGSRGSTDGRGGRLRGMVAVTQIALVCVLLTGAGLLTRSLSRVLDVDPGFTGDNVIAVRVDPERTLSGAQQTAFFDAVVREVSALPGVQAVGLTDALPLGDNFGWRRWNATPQDATERSEGLEPLVRIVDDGYLGAMKIPLRAGRSFTAADGASGGSVVIINERLARTLWPDKDAVGRFIKTSGQTRQVVGVVGDVRYFGLDRDADIEMYMPLRAGNFNSVDLVVRSAIPPVSLTNSIRSALRRVDPRLPVPEAHTMEQLVSRSVFARRFVVRLVAGFAVFGLLLASLGIYGVISYSVMRRQLEIGIRMALGATPGNVRAAVLTQTGTLVAIGLAIGLPASAVAARAVQSLLYNVGASDPATFLGVLTILVGVAALAGYLPARRATRVDPAIALRQQ